VWLRVDWFESPADQPLENDNAGVQCMHAGVIGWQPCRTPEKTGGFEAQAVSFSKRASMNSQLSTFEMACT
jgi:hypothetical protein